MQIRLSAISLWQFFLLRFIQLKVSKIPLFPLLFVAPRGLITILLFLGIAPEQRIFLNKSLIIQVILMTAIIMMLGLMITKKGK
jgi:putative effector of murein hydrolase